jgi:hypothetical protein
MSNDTNSKEKTDVTNDDINFRNSVIDRLNSLQKQTASLSEYASKAKEKEKKKEKAENKRRVGDTSSRISGLQKLSRLGESVYKRNK